MIRPVADRKWCHNGRMIVAAGPREAERRMLEWVDGRTPKDSAELWPPLRVVVPSRSLRRHVLALLARELGALAGVIVQTHRSLAREVLEAADEPLPAGASTVQELLVRQLASRQPVLRDVLDDFEDGYAPVAAAVRDLVDAGLDEVSLGPVADAVSEAARGQERERCLAVVQVAGRWLKAAERENLPSRSGLLVRATELLERGDDGTLPSRGILIHGFAEATGIVAGFLEALVRTRDAEMVLDLPPDPARPGERDAGWTFAERLADRLASPGWLSGGPWQPPGKEPPDLVAFTAPGPDAEIREVAGRIRRLLDNNEHTAPESIGMVARSIDTVTAAAIRRHFGRLGIPFSGENVTLPSGEPVRRLTAVLELLSNRGRTSVTTWLTAVDSIPGVKDLRLLELALRSAGVARLDGLDEMDPGKLCPRGILRLPVVERIVDDGEKRGKQIHRSFPRTELEAARRAASTLLAALAGRSAEAPASKHLHWVRAILDRLGLGGDATLAGSLDALQTLLAADPVIAWKHLEPVLSRALGDAESEALGGEGGGVKVLTVMEARSRTFEHLFLVGLNRGSFPRKVHEDPVLSENVRRAIAEVLPEMPLAERSRLEERYLFAQLMAASPRTTLSWQVVDADGRARNPSAFVERLCLEGRLPGPVPTVADVFGPAPGEAPMRPALEHATVCGLAGRREDLVAAAQALGDGRVGHLKPLLDELDPPSPRDDLGPFLGLTGIAPPQEVWATRLEAYSACPWKQFLERELGLTLPPEAILAGTRLKGILVGKVVHRVLEWVVTRACASVGRPLSVEDIRNREPVCVPWPVRDTLERMIQEASREVAAAEGVASLAVPLARAASPLLERARELDWPEGIRKSVLGAEVTGECYVELNREDRAAIHFRADRVDSQDGALVLTDYKSGKSKDSAVTALRKGKQLQAAIYACGGGDGARGRYLYLNPDTARAEDGLDRTSAAALVRVVEILLEAWSRGLAVPRWDPGGNERNGPCRYCDLKEACFRGDSTFRARLERVIERAGEAGTAGSLVQLWNLPTTPASKRGHS